MNAASFHLNLLKETEKLSSSPIRVRVMLPTMALLACIGMAVWWGVIFTQTIMAKTSADSIDETIREKKAAHAEVIARMELARELKLELEQLDYYSNGVRHVAEPLAKFAEAMPVRVQLTSLSIAEPLPQNLKGPNPKLPPLWGPAENCETQKLAIAGRSLKEVQIQQMMDSLEAPEYTPLVTREHRINSFRQDENATSGGKRLLAFEVEYTMPERRFAK